MSGTTLKLWRMLGAPVSSMTIASSLFKPDADDDFFAWAENWDGVWVNYKTTDPEQYPTFLQANGSDNFISGRGYLVAYNESAPTKTFGGTLNTGDITFNLRYHEHTGPDWDYQGWNLLSNPYSSSIDWNKANRSELQDNIAYIYDGDKIGTNGKGGYVEVDGNNTNAYIGANQGFFVLAKTTSNGENFTFGSAMQTHSGGNFLKATVADNSLVLRLSSQNYYDETTIILAEDCSFDRDRRDALKLFSYSSDVPQLYSISKDEINLAINRIPGMSVEMPIPLGVRIPKAELYTISIQDNSSSFASNIVYLEDKETNTLHKLSGEDYQFSSPQGDINNRFVLHFGMTDIEENENAELLNIWAYNNQLNIISEIGEAQLQIFDIQGRLMLSKNIYIDGKYSEILHLQAGAYVVRLQNNKTVESRKIILQ